MLWLITMITGIFPGSSSTAFAASVSQPPQTLPSGNWSIEIVSSLEGMSLPVPLPTIKRDRCVTEHDSRNLKSWATSEMKANGCKLNKFEVKTSAMSWDYSCTNGLSGVGHGTWTANAFRADNVTQVAALGQAMPVTQVITGKRTRDCP